MPSHATSTESKTWITDKIVTQNQAGKCGCMHAMYIKLVLCMYVYTVKV